MKAVERYGQARRVVNPDGLSRREVARLSAQPLGADAEGAEPRGTQRAAARRLPRLYHCRRRSLPRC